MLDDKNEVKGRLWKALYKCKRKKFSDRMSSRPMGWSETGIEGAELKFERGYLKKLFHGQHDSDRMNLEKIQATIPSIEIRKKLAIRERLNNIWH